MIITWGIIRAKGLIDEDQEEETDSKKETIFQEDEEPDLNDEKEERQ